MKRETRSFSETLYGGNKRATPFIGINFVECLHRDGKRGKGKRKRTTMLDYTGVMQIEWACAVLVFRAIFLQISGALLLVNDTGHLLHVDKLECQVSGES